jgi:BASS family bile acid:Na+ symporter
MDLAILVNVLTLAGLIAIMLSMGLRVTVAEVLAAVRKPRQVVLGLVANFVLVPAVTLGLLYLFDINPMIALGFLILAVCPGAPVAPPFVAIARGDVPGAIGQMVILGGLSALLSPALLSVLLPQLLPAGEMRIDYLAIVRTLLIAQLLPLAIGLGIHHGAPRLSERIAKPVGLLANLLLLGVVVLVLAQQYAALAIVRLRGWVGMLLLLAASLGIGWLCGGPGVATRKSLALTTGVRNVAVALVIVSDNFPDTLGVSAVVVYGLVSIFATLGCAFVLAAVAAPPEGKLLREGSRTP